MRRKTSTTTTTTTTATTAATTSTAAAPCPHYSHSHSGEAGDGGCGREAGGTVGLAEEDGVVEDVAEGSLDEVGERTELHDSLAVGAGQLFLVRHQLLSLRLRHPSEADSCAGCKRSERKSASEWCPECQNSANRLSLSLCLSVCLSVREKGEWSEGERKRKKEEESERVGGGREREWEGVERETERKRERETETGTETERQTDRETEQAIENE